MTEPISFTWRGNGWVEETIKGESMKHKFIARIMGLFFIFGCTSNLSDKIIAQERLLGDNMAPAFTLESIGGKKITLSNFKGKVVLLDFWATWCPPCRFSIPALVQLHQKFKDKKFEILGISLDENKKTVLPFMKKAKIEYPVLYAKGTTVDQDYRIRAIPTFILLDQTGKIVQTYTGFHSDVVKEWEKEIQILLAK